MVKNTGVEPELIAAVKFVEKMKVKADGLVGNYYPWWYGWALRAAFLDGVAYAEKKEKKKEEKSGGRLALQEGKYIAEGFPRPIAK